jgi:hypothetical protein
MTFFQCSGSASKSGGSTVYVFGTPGSASESRGTDPRIRIRIRTKMSWMHDTGYWGLLIEESVPFFVFQREGLSAFLIQQFQLFYNTTDINRLVFS